jgi:CHAD domain-containing protein
MFLEKYIQQSPEHQALSLLLQDHKDRRGAVQKTIIEGLENLQSSGVLKELSVFLEQNVNELSKTPFDALSVLEKACWNITSMIDDLLSLACYVHQESAILKHHEMRIKAKRLRYTMETFAPLYKGGLKAAIQQMKAFQDLLGEMHDSDVWLAFLSTLSGKTDFDFCRFTEGYPRFFSFRSS